MLICNCSCAFDQNLEVTYSCYLVYSTQQGRIKPGKKQIFPLRCPEYFGPKSLSSDSLWLRLLFLPFPAPHSLRIPEQTVELELCLILAKDKRGCLTVGYWRLWASLSFRILFYSSSQGQFPKEHPFELWYLRQYSSFSTVLSKVIWCFH